MTRIASICQQFRRLHTADLPLVLPNPWDAGSARIFAHVGFRALATTSSGFAATLGLRDGDVSREDALRYAEAIVDAVEVPVSADLEHGFGRDTAEVADTYMKATACGLAGASIEDSTGDRDRPVFDLAQAVDRVRAAAEAAHGVDPDFVLTGRAENFLHGRHDLADTIARLQAYQEAGADVLYAPGLVASEEIRSVVTSVDRPVNVLLRSDGPTVAELGQLGVARISVGGSLAFAAYGAAVHAARELLEQGTAHYFADAAIGRDATHVFDD